MFLLCRLLPGRVPLARPFSRLHARVVCNDTGPDAASVSKQSLHPRSLHWRQLVPEFSRDALPELVRGQSEANHQVVQRLGGFPLASLFDVVQEPAQVTIQRSKDNDCVLGAIGFQDRRLPFFVACFVAWRNSLSQPFTGKVNAPKAMHVYQSV